MPNIHKNGAEVGAKIENKLENITSSRISNARKYDQKLSGIDEINIPKRDESLKEVFHLYQFTCEKRDELANFLKSKGIDAKVHYPIPMHLQPASKKFGYKNGDFPIAEKLSNSSISLPAHEFITDDQIEYTTDLIKEFYKKI